MSEDFRQELIHKLRLKRVDEAIAEVIAVRLLIERDMEVLPVRTEEHETCMTT